MLEVSTDKVDTEIPSPAAGVLKKIVAQEDDTVEVGGELAVIGDAGEGDGEAPAEEPAAEEEAGRGGEARRGARRAARAGRRGDRGRTRTGIEARRAAPSAAVERRRC